MIDKNKIKSLTQQFLLAIGEDPNREGLQDTPNRVANMCKELFSTNKKDLSRTAFSSSNFDGIVMVKNIDFSSVCEHHLLPFFGQVSVAYIPNKKVLGLSKLARIVETFSKRPQLQERLAKQILDEVVRVTKPKGAIVFVEATHTCMTIRGVKKPNATTNTLVCSGEFERPDMQNLFLSATKN